MKIPLLLFAASLLSTAVLAQQTKPNTEVKVRDNGTEKIVTKTGKTNVGQALENTADAAGNVVKKVDQKLKKVAKKTDTSAKKEGLKVSGEAKKVTAKAEKATEPKK